MTVDVMAAFPIILSNRGSAMTYGYQKHQIGMDRMRAQQRKKRDRLFLEAHRRDTDAQLMEYLMGERAKLDHRPKLDEVPGSRYMSKRMGRPWESLCREAEDRLKDRGWECPAAETAEANRSNGQ